MPTELLRVLGDSAIQIRKGLWEVISVSIPDSEGRCVLEIRHLGNCRHIGGKIEHVSSWWFPNGKSRLRSEMAPPHGIIQKGQNHA